MTSEAIKRCLEELWRLISLELHCSLAGIMGPNSQPHNSRSIPFLRDLRRGLLSVEKKAVAGAELAQRPYADALSSAHVYLRSAAQRTGSSVEMFHASVFLQMLLPSSNPQASLIVERDCEGIQSWILARMFPIVHFPEASKLTFPYEPMRCPAIERYDAGKAISLRDSLVTTLSRTTVLVQMTCFTLRVFVGRSSLLSEPHNGSDYSTNHLD